MSSNDPVFRRDRQPSRRARVDEVEVGYMMWILTLLVGIYLLAAILAWRLAIALVDWKRRRRGGREASRRSTLSGIAIMPGDGHGVATISRSDATRTG